jgi:hypothetical protein
MADSPANVVKMALPHGAPITPFKAKHLVEVDLSKGVPFVDKKDHPDQLYQSHLIAHARTFDLGKPEDLAVYEQVWQQVSTGLSKMADHPTPTYDPVRGTWVAFLRWGEIVVKLPE